MMTFHTTHMIKLQYTHICIPAIHTRMFSKILPYQSLELTSLFQAPILNTPVTRVDLVVLSIRFPFTGYALRVSSITTRSIAIEVIQRFSQSTLRTPLFHHLILSNGRDGEIRTLGFTAPNRALYQTELHPVKGELQSDKTRYVRVVGQEGFEPPKATPSGLQPDPFVHSGTDPCVWQG